MALKIMELRAELAAFLDTGPSEEAPDRTLTEICDEIVGELKGISRATSEFTLAQREWEEAGRLMRVAILSELQPVEQDLLGEGNVATLKIGLMLIRVDSLVFCLRILGREDLMNEAAEASRRIARRGLVQLTEYLEAMERSRDFNAFKTLRDQLSDSDAVIEVVHKVVRHVQTGKDQGTFFVDQYETELIRRFLVAVDRHILIVKSMAMRTVNNEATASLTEGFIRHLRQIRQIMDGMNLRDGLKGVIHTPQVGPHLAEIEDAVRKRRRAQRDGGA